MNKAESEEQVVTVEVVPQTVTEIIYLDDQEYDCKDVPATPKIESYEVNNVDISHEYLRSIALDPLQFCTSSAENELNNSVEPFFDREDHNSGIGEFICTLCKFKCRSLSSLTSHRLIHDRQFVKCHYNCVACGQQFDKAQTLSHHFRTTHSKFTCTICKHSCSEEREFKLHLQRHQAKQYRCETCRKVYDTPMKLVNHQKQHAETTFLYACNKCSESFATIIEVSTHLRKAHEKAQLPSASYFVDIKTKKRRIKK